MIYFNGGKIIIRDMKDTDPQAIHAQEMAQGHHRTPESFANRLADRRAGLAVPLVAEYFGDIAGYVNVYRRPGKDGKNRCEIEDLGVFVKYRNRGIGSNLMDVAEQIAAGYSGAVHLAVGLHSGYGAAQRMYARRGYVPDGSGVWYGGAPLAAYANCKNDDGLVLWMSKKL